MIRNGQRVYFGCVSVDGDVAWVGPYRLKESTAAADANHAAAVLHRQKRLKGVDSRRALSPPWPMAGDRDCG